MSSDERLALRAAKGDQRAFEEIYARYHRDLYRFCLAMVGNPQDAQDALQNTMVKVLRGLPGEERTIKLKPWLYRIARNEAVERLRRRRDSVELEPHQMTAAPVAETAENRERLRLLLADLEQLPDRQRAVLVMRELSGLDFEQIGSAFGTSAAVARQTLYEARLSLRQLEAGREMRCADVMRELSNADGRVTRRREIRAHLRSCADCRTFRDSIARRHEDLAALSPLPVAASAGLLHGVLGAKASATAGTVTGGTAGTIGVGAGKTIATSALVKSAATVAVVAVAGVSAADRGGLVHLPLPGRGHGEPAAAPPVPPSKGAASNATTAGSASAPSLTSKGNSESRQSSTTTARERGEGDPASIAQQESSRSEAGGSPPGGGHGRSAAQQHGRPDSLPAAAEKGQQTAAAHKSEHASAPPGQSAESRHGQGGAGASKPSAPPKAQAETPPPPELPAEGGSDAKNGGAHSGPKGTPPGLEG